MHRVLVPPESIGQRSITIHDPKILHHLTRVLRLQVGEPIECFDGQGRGYAGSILRVGHREMTVAVERAIQEPAVGVRITLAQALIKPDRFDWVIEKATELGASRIIPMVTARTTSRVTSERAGRLVRWRRLAVAAAEQCGRTTIPTIDPPAPFARVVEMVRGGPALVPTLAVDGPSLAAHLKTITPLDAMVVLIGPEGDFTSQEINVAIQRGLQPVRLGRLTLRSETAAITVLAVLQQMAASS